MSYSYIQTPASMSLGQSPTIFSVSSSTLIGQIDFQYVGNLFIYSGDLISGSGQTFQLAKYPSTNGYTGIFDVSRILNSTQTELTQTNISPVKYFTFESYYRYLSGSVYVTGSHITSSVFKSVDGYQLFPEPIGEQVYNLTPHWPLMTDGPATQSVFIENVGSASVYVGNVGTTLPTKVVYSGSNGSNGIVALTAANGNSNNEIVAYPQAPAETGFPLSLIGLDSYTIQPYSNATPLGTKLRFDITCQQKYPNIRIKWKNRYGAFDYLNFDMINRKSITSSKRTYQPQLGNWQDATLSYNEYDSQTLNYIVDSNQTIKCNTNWLDEGYNEILKQLLVSSEIYWCQENTQEVKPLTITTTNIQFRTGVNDHLIQYTFDFAFGQGYKMII